MKLLNEQDRAAYKNIWILAQFERDSALNPVSYELLRAARELAQAKGCEVWAVALGADLSKAPRE